mmetsp:Transcript_8040/g.21730  ORF Transcript_8040/g.21730 Transcript_8040/m.21730 type:complete len:250 (-) Transcript_8040:169-918(-)|eukprot:CAMPEP_0198126212 /NCGR_PEP_ID=MMETSP1442-20131203/44307_1 /TAXON_ID= /ORGANISM="Craspedostauros australis, Strain CCMP3328" /LENGTH=249 /DNA_ID=CAMNT_0043785961 /DNA_START=147 /DNA_END=896 /DNA_ORIENTATION=+
MTPSAPYKTLLLDMDGVLAEVSKSYRAAIISTCHKYGATSINDDVVGDWKAKGGSNNDWKLSLDLINSDPNGAKDLTLQQVTDTFEEFYQGKDGQPGLCDLESLIPTKATLDELRKRSNGVGIVTGRPKKDCDKFLKQNDLEKYVDCCVCMEDGPPKPDAFPVRRACELLKIEPSASVILVGDTPDDIRAAVAAGCKGVGVATPEAVEAAAAKGEAYDSTKLCVAMKECGADVILEPGFVKLVDMFPAN